MLILTGDILDWFAAGILFPLMLLPVATLFPGRSYVRSIVWFCAVTGIAGAGIVFVWLVPSLSLTLSFRAAGIFVLCLCVLSVTVFKAGGPYRVCNILAPAFSGSLQYTARGAMLFLLAMAAVQFPVVILRYVFGINSIFMQESVTYMHAAVIMLAGGYTFAVNGHVRVDIFYRHAAEKHKALINLAGIYVFLFPVCLLVLWTASPYVASSWAVLEGSAERSGIKAVFVLKSLIPAFAVLLAMAGFTTAVKACDTLRAHSGYRDG